MNIHTLRPFDETGALQVVLECPRGSALKLDYDPHTSIFKVARALPVGTTYPFDWGFIPGTRGQDGDPLDAMVIHDNATHPGVLLPCRALGMVLLSQLNPKGKRETNNRILAGPTWDTAGTGKAPTVKLDRPLRDELEQFFLSATFFTAKKARVEGWVSAEKADAFIRQCARPHARPEKSSS